MFLEAIRTLYRHNTAANDRVLQTAVALAPDRFVVDAPGGRGSIRNILVHTFDTQIVHIAWLDGSMSKADSFARLFRPEDYPDVAAVRRLWERAATETDRYLATLSQDSDLGRNHAQATGDGAAGSRRAWEVMLHVAMHSMQHRSEVAMLLTAAGHSPGDLDLL